jgi:hypothetical protein
MGIELAAAIEWLCRQVAAIDGSTIQSIKERQMKAVVAFVMVMAVVFMCTGCMGRMISEGLGAATGASGKVVSAGATPWLTAYRSLRVEPVTVASATSVPADVPGVIRADFEAAAMNRGLTPNGKPVLKLVSEIIHYETSDTVDTAIGPLAEVILRARLIDAQSGKVIAEANLIGRSKATSSSGAKTVSAGAGKALGKWLNAGGLKKEKGGEKEED